jgi:hypothetical protein
MNIDWSLFPLLETNVQARDWLLLQAKLVLARNTIVAYGRGLNDFLSFCRRTNVLLEAASESSNIPRIRWNQICSKHTLSVVRQQFSIRGLLKDFRPRRGRKSFKRPRIENCWLFDSRTSPDISLTIIDQFGLFTIINMIKHFTFFH